MMPKTTAATAVARLEVPRNGGRQREDWPAEIVLRLGTAPQKVRRRVVDQDERGVAGAEVWIHDPTLFGIAGMLPLQLEYLIADGEVSPQAARMPVPFADDPTQDGLAIYRRARALLERIPLRQAVRLIGLSVSGLAPAAAGQLSLLDPDPARRERLTRAMDRVIARFGEEALRPASLLGKPRRGPRPFGRNA